MRRIVLHIVFWLAYWLIYAYTYSRYDGNLAKYLLTEGIQMPARMLATYASIWMLEHWRRHTWLALTGVVVATVLGGLLNRLLKLWYLVPVFFPDSTIEYWNLGRMMVDIFDCVLAAGVALSARLFFQQQASLQREERLRREKAEAELLALKSQIQPHFLFNTINNLYALARMKSEKTAPVALQLANLLRFVLYETRKPSIPIELEVKILQDYIALEALRFDEDRLQIKTIIELDDPKQPVTPLLLLPLVENAFKHGVGEHRTDAWVRVSIKLKKGKLEFSVENSADPAPKQNAGGIGIANVRRQLELIYPGRSRLHLENRVVEAGEPARAFQVVLEVDLHDPT